MKSKKTKPDPATIGNPKWIRIVGIRFDDDSKQARYRVRYTDEEGVKRYEDIDKQDFLQPSEVLKTLARLNARIPSKQTDDLKAEVVAAVRHGNKTTTHVAASTGWTSDGNSFVYYGHTFGALSGKLIHKGTDEIDHNLGKQEGTIKGWRALAPQFEASDYLIFAASIPAAGPLLVPLGHDEGVVYHFHGASTRGNEQLRSALRSSSGKSTAARVALSMTGRCIGPLQSPDVTKRGMEVYCAAHNHIAVVLDDASRTSKGGANSVEWSELPYFLANGSGRRRAAREFPNLRWLVPVITNGEQPLEDLFCKSRQEGAQVRMVPIPVPPGVKGGIFNRVKSTGSRRRKECRMLARGTRQVIAINHGIVMPAYLGYLVPHKGRSVAKAKARVTEFLKEIGPCKDPWEYRYAEKFAIVYAAAVLLAEFGIAPWSPKRAMIAVKHLYQVSRSASIREDEAADAFLKRLGRLIARNAFPHVPKGSAVRRHGGQPPQGITRDVGHHRRVVVIPHQQFKKLVQPAAAHDVVERELEARGLLIKGSDGQRTRQVMVEGLTASTRPRCICLTLPWIPIPPAGSAKRNGPGSRDLKALHTSSSMRKVGNGTGLLGLH